MPSLPLPFSALGPPLELSAIVRFEEETRRRIPEPYRAFLMRANGAELALPIFHYRRNPRGRLLEGSIDALLGIGLDDELKDLGHFIKTYVERDRIPRDLYPIGVNDGDDLILMGGAGPRLGQIYYWFHELEDVYFVANTLDEFLASLKPFLMAVD